MSTCKSSLRKEPDCMGGVRCVRTSYAHTYVRMRIHSLQMVAAYGKEYSLPK